MLRPTYNDLIGSLNNGAEEGSQEVESRYSVVIASARRARQLINGDEPLIPGEEGKKPLSVAIEEISKNAVTIQKSTEVEDEPVSVRPGKEAFSKYALDDEEYGEDEELSEDEDDGEDYSEDDYESDSEA